MSRAVRAALVGAAAAAAYAAAGELGRPIRGRSLLTAAALLTATTMSAKAYVTEQRVNALLAVAYPGLGRLQAPQGLTLGANLNMSSNNITNLAEVNTDGTNVGIHGNLYMNGKNIYLQGGSVVP